MPWASLKAALAVAIIALGMSAGDTAATRPHLDLPRLMLWSWDRTDDLSFIDPANTGVAYLAATLHLADRDVTITPRRNPIVIPPGAKRIAVFHVELDRAHPPVLDATQSRALAAAIASQMQTGDTEALQLDFEVVQSQQGFLATTATALRQRLPATPISMTALSSWCLTENWIGRLPVDEVVPMLFRLGPDGNRTRAHFAAGGDFTSPSCRGGLGIATDELADTAPLTARLSDRRVYVFSPKHWTAADYATLRRKLSAWPAVIASLF